LENISNSFLQLAGLSFAKRVQFVLEKIWPNQSTANIENAIRSSFTRENFGTNSICPIFKKEETSYIAEMFRGPTGSFKDLHSLLMPYIVPARRLNLVAASGSSAVAAAVSFTKANRAKALIFYSKTDISEKNYLELATVNSKNVVAMGLNSEICDIQRKIDEIAGHNEKINLINSMYLGKSAPLAACLISLYCELLTHREIKIGEPINIKFPRKHSSLQQAILIAANLGMPISRNACKSLALQTKNPIRKKDLSELKERPIISDAILNLEQMEQFIGMVEL